MTGLLLMTAAIAIAYYTVRKSLVSYLGTLELGSE